MAQQQDLVAKISKEYIAICLKELEQIAIDSQGRLRGLVEHCRNKYQQEPIIWAAENLYLRGGSEPLDQIYTFKNPKPRHWHYVGFGLSDIHGYSKYCSQLNKMLPNWMFPGREPLIDMYPPRRPSNEQGPGYGFELTMRVKCNSDEEWNGKPPEWPRHIMQQLAKYVVETRNELSVGDHIAWHCPLVGDSSRIRHILFAQDPTLDVAKTSEGPVKFIQIVGVCSEELQRAQEWSVKGILEMMRQREDTGGPLLVTDMRREKTIFELEPQKENEAHSAIKQEGSDMRVISAEHKTSHTMPDWYILAQKNDDMNDDNPTLNCIGFKDSSTARPPSRMSVSGESALKIENFKEQPPRYCKEIYILLDYHAALILPVMLECRLAHGRHFYIQDPWGNSLIDFVPESCKLVSHYHKVNNEKPIAKKGILLEIYVPNDLRKQMCETIGKDFESIRKMILWI